MNTKASQRLRINPKLNLLIQNLIDSFKKAHSDFFSAKTQAEALKHFSEDFIKEYWELFQKLHESQSKNKGTNLGQIILPMPDFLNQDLIYSTRVNSSAIIDRLKDLIQINRLAISKSKKPSEVQRLQNQNLFLERYSYLLEKGLKLNSTNNLRLSTARCENWLRAKVD